MGKGQSLDASVNWSRYSQVDPAWLRRALFPGQADPARRADLPPRLQQLQFHRQRATQHDLLAGQHRRRAFGLGFPLTEFTELRRPLQPDRRRHHARQGHLLHRSGRRRPAGRRCATRSRPAAICATRSATGSRRWSAIRRSTTIPTGFARPAGSVVVLSQDFAGLGGDVKYLRTRADGDQILGHSAATGSSRSTARAATSTRVQIARPGSRCDPADRPLLRPAAARFRHPRHRPAGPARPLQRRRRPRPTRRGGITDALGGRAYYRPGSELEFPLSASLRSIGLRPSAFVDAGSLWSITQPMLLDVDRHLHARRGQ